MDIQTILAKLKESLTIDEALGIELKGKLTELIDEVVKNPTQSNVEALQAVLETLSDAEKYSSAISSLTSLVMNRAA